ncbi:hypothetical protein FS749_007920 [Ceratobasidium sp. UAMH 11750]|nr:hypothetical protein FS749_007920 [Ceratobasidium sp. UAMH 11750]
MQGGSEWEDDDESQAITRSPDDPALELVWMVCHLREIIPEPPGNLYAMTEKLVYDLETATLGGLEVDKIGIKILEQSVPVIPHDYDLLARIVFILRDSYERLFKAQGDLAHVESAIRWTQYGILTLPKDHLDWLILSSNLGMLFHTRFKLLGNLANIKKAIDCLDQVVSLTLDTDEARPSRLRHLGAALCSRFDYLGNPADIDMAIGHQTQALALIGDGHLHKPIWLNQLGIYLQQRCHRLGTRADIERAIEIQSQALALTTGAENEARAEQLRSLADTYDSRFVLLGDLADIHKAIDYFNEALSLVAEGYADTHMYLNGLGRALVRRFNREGNPADIERAIDCHHKAVLRSPNGCLDNACSLASLAASYQYRFERLGNLEDIDKSIDYGLQALSTFPDGHSGKLLELGRVGVVYEARFERLEDLADIDKAIECQTQAISLIPKDHPGMPEYLQALGNSRMLRFQRLGNLADIDLAISLGDEAISLAPHGNHGLPGWLNNLGVSYHVRFNHGGKSEDVDKAIDCFNQASLLLPDDDSAKPSCLSNLGTSYTYRFRRLNNPSDIDSAIEYFSQAVYLTTSENVSLPATLNNLGASYRNRFDLLQERTDIELAIQNLISASKSSVGHPFMKLKASLEWARLSTRYNISSPLEAYQHVMELVPQVGWLGMTVGQRYENIAYNLGNLALEAAASAIEHQSYDLAVEWLDEGRSVVWNQLLQIRTPLDRLFEQHPLLAQGLSRVAQELEQISSSEPTDLSLSLYAPVSERLGQRRHRLAEQWERLIDEVRSLPGFQSFLKPKKLAELAIAAQSGPVAIVNVYKNRCDALVLHRDSDLVIHIPLPSFSHTKALEARTQLLGVLSHANVRARGTRRPIFHQDNVEVRFEDVLATLWTGVVRPILDRLGYLVSIHSLFSYFSPDSNSRHHQRMNCHTSPGVQQDHLYSSLFTLLAFTTNRGPKYSIMLFPLTHRH